MSRVPKVLIPVLFITVVLTGCIGAGAHIDFTTDIKETTEAGLPGSPTFPNNARHPDSSGVTQSQNVIAFVISSPTAYRGISGSQKYGVSSPFLEFGIDRVNAFFVENSGTGDDPSAPLIPPEDGPSVPVEVER